MQEVLNITQVFVLKKLYGNDKMKKGALEMNYSPLRYPGGKSKLTPLVEKLMQSANINNGVYVEPFVGGGGVALSLLINKKVRKIIINDYDIAIYSVWYAILNETNKFLQMIDNAILTVDEWKKQKDFYIKNKTTYSIELAFATFYLNRTNRSGILKAGPIGGYEQKGNYPISARFNKEKLKERVQLIASYKTQVELYNLEIKDFIKNVIPMLDNDSFIYFDPPYYKKGKELYTNFFNPCDHEELSKLIFDVQLTWMITYDDVSEIEKLYTTKSLKRFDINYSVANSGKKSEIIALSHNYWPSATELETLEMNIR